LIEAEVPADLIGGTEHGRKAMARSKSRHLLCAGVAFAFVLSLGAEVAAQPGSRLIFQDSPGGWQHPFGGAFPPVQGSAPPIRQDPRHSFVNPAQSWRIGDLSNPNLKQWARDVMQKDIDEINGGKAQFSASSSCVPPGIPHFMQGGGPFIFLQTPEKVVIIEEAGPNVRYIYLNVPHSDNPKPSWYGESVGWYEGNTLVVDTIGQNTKTFIDTFRTPHTEKLHVVERWYLTDGGNTLRVDITVDDPDTFYQPWRTYQLYQRVEEPLSVELCAENNSANLFDYGTPEDDTPDF
jgi:hypothetical protein